MRCSASGLGGVLVLGLMVGLVGCSDDDDSNGISDPGPPPGGEGLTFLFIHHSVGDGFLHDGGMWGMLESAGYEVHDRTYGDGWVGDNTDPADWPVTFTQYYNDMISWELPAGERYDVVAFKSCFPASHIDSDAMLAQYQGYYDVVRSVTRSHPETLFIPFSTPPLVPNETDPAAAARARAFANWLCGPYDAGETNLVAYDLFNVLAGGNPSSGDFNCLRYDYQSDPWDSHPNSLANRRVAQDFTAFLTSVANAHAHRHVRRALGWVRAAPR